MYSTDSSADPRSEAAGGWAGRRPLRPPAGVIALIAIEVALGVLYLIGPLLPGSLSEAAFWNLNTERSIGTWYSTSQLAILGVMLLALAVFRRGAAVGSAIAFGLAGLVALLLSLDEQARLHERFARFVDSLPAAQELGLDRSGPWMLVAAPVLLAVLAAIALGARADLRGRRRVVWLFGAGALLFVMSFAGMEVVRNFVAAGTAADRILALVEELGEMLGVTLVVWAVYELMRSHGIQVLSAGPKPATR